MTEHKTSVCVSFRLLVFVRYNIKFGPNHWVMHRLKEMLSRDSPNQADKKYYH